MKVLVVCKAHPNGEISPFVRDQASSVERLGVHVEFLPIIGRGMRPYLAHVSKLRRRIRRGGVDLIHAYYGLSGMTTLFEPSPPLVMSFLGCDFNTLLQRIPARLTLCHRASVCIFMNQHMQDLSGNIPGSVVLPFGIDMTRFAPADKAQARQALGLEQDKRYVLFSSSFNRPEKNPGLARQTMSLLNHTGAELLEFKTSYTPREVVNLFNACDVLLLTSKREGSPQVVKEAMACGLPVVSTSVGDVPWLFGDTPGCILARPNPNDLAEAVRHTMQIPRHNHGRKRLETLCLDLHSTARRLIEVYIRATPGMTLKPSARTASVSRTEQHHVF